jgi:hypothetical protein
MVPRDGKRLKIVLRAPGYEDLEVPVTADGDRTSDHELKLKKRGQLPDPKRGSGNRGSGGTGPGSSDSDLMKPF